MLLSSARSAAVVTVLAAACTCFVQAKPKAYPDVALSAGSQPRYGAVAMDAWKSKVAYLLFDGNVSNGYARVYVWIPGDAKYGRPVAFGSPGGSRFGPFQVQVENEGEISRVAWILAAQKHAQTGGTHTHFDYATGKATTVTRQAWERVNFSGTANLARGEKMDMVGQSEFPLDITVGGGLQVFGEWKDVGAPYAAWEHLNYRVGGRPEAGPEEKGRLVLTGVLNAKVRSLPEEAVVEVKVQPYLEDPIVTATYGVDELARGIPVSAPYGWYTISWKLDCEWLTGRLTGTTGVFPLSKAVSQ